MAMLMRSYDWSQTSLGAAETWSQSLKTAVRIMLTSRQAMFVWWGDELLNLYNDAYRSILGGKHPEALGQPAALVWREIWDQVGPRAETALQQNQGTYDEALLLIMERNGYPEETYYTFSYSPVPDDDGSPGGIICANTEDTPRIIGERQLALLKELAATTADARTFDDACTLSARCLAANPYDLPFALIYLIDADRQQVTLAGRCGIEQDHPAVPETVLLETAGTETAGLETMQLADQSDQGWPFAEVVQSHEAVWMTDLSDRFADLPMGGWQRPPHQAVVLPIAPSGRTGQAGILVVGLNPFRLFDENYRGFLDLVSAQIAASIANAQAYEEERKRAESLAELDRAKTTFFSNVSHEFRTPLTLILSPLEELLATGTALPPEYRQQLELMHRNSLRLMKLVNTLLDFSRIEAGRIQAVYEPIDLAALTAELASVFRSAIEQAGMRLMVDCPPLPEPVYVDREMWEKIILNLLSNAFKFTFTGEIALSLRSEQTQVELTIRDTGIGIPTAEIPHLFERFHRVEGARGRTQEGSGIGLALVRELVELHGGQVRVESQEGVGTTFLITIPTGTAHLPADRIQASRTLASTALGAAPYVEEALRWLPEQLNLGEFALDPVELPPLDAAVVPPAYPPLPLSPSRILLVDDNTDMRNYVKRLLLSQGYQVRVAADGQAALAMIQQQIPDLVLTDVMMPRLDGFELVRILRSDPAVRDLPIILLSARAGEEARVEGLAAGADDYLTKPFAARELLARIEATLKLAGIRKETEQRIREKEERLLFALAAARMVAWSWDLKTELSQRLGNTIEILGLESGDVNEFYRLIHPDDRPKVEAAIDRAIQGEAPYELEFRLVTPDGRLLWLADKAQLQYDDQGEPAYLIGVCVDITDRKRAEEMRLRLAAERERLLQTLAAERTQFEAVLRQMPEGVMIADADSGRLVLSNQQASQILQQDLMLDLAAEPERAMLFQAYRLDGQPYALRDYPLARSLRTGEVISHEEIELRLEDGRRIFIDTNSSPIYNSQGQLISAVTVFQDITQRKQIESALRESERRFRRLVESNMFGVAFGDFSGGIHYVNDYFLNMVGYTEAELKAGKLRWIDLTPPEFAALDRQAIAELQATGVATPFEKVYIRKDGTRVPILIGSTLLDEPHRQQEVISFLIDLTERKRVEAAWQEGKQTLDAILEYIPEGITIADAPDVVIQQISRYGQQLTGRPLETLIKIPAAIQAERWGLLRPDGTVPEAQELPLTRAVQQAEVVTDEEWILQRPDATTIHILCNAGPIRNSTGQPMGGVIAWRDITDRKQSEEVLRQALQKLNFHVENTPMAVIEWDGELRISRWSGAAERIFGWQAAEMLGKSLWELQIVVDADQAQVAQVADRLMFGQESYLFSYNCNYTKSGAIVACEWHNSSLRDESGRMCSVLSLVLDVTDKKQAEAERNRLLQQEQAAREAAESANRIKDEFLAVVSHELRSPLNPILGWAKLLRSRQLDAQKTEQALAVIERNAQMQAQLINDLLDVSRILRGKLSLNPSPVDLVTTIQSAIETVRLAADAKSIQINTQLDPTIGQVSGDPGRLQQIVWNLLSNAVKFTPEGGQINIRLSGAEASNDGASSVAEPSAELPPHPHLTYAQISVTDTGKGIHPDFLPHVFEHFRQEDSATTRRFGGLGLGLAIVRYLVELHGGTVQADSSGEGQGATFTVSLPLISLPVIAAPETAPVRQANLQGIRILVVDDDDETREFLAFLLELRGATVIMSASASEAITILTQFQPDLLLSDIGMPDMDGYMLIRQVRSLPPEQGGQIPAIALTAYAGESDHQQAMTAGFQKHLSKPVDPDTLVESIVHLLR